MGCCLVNKLQAWTPAGHVCLHESQLFVFREIVSCVSVYLHVASFITHASADVTPCHVRC